MLRRMLPLSLLLVLSTALVHTPAYPNAVPAPVLLSAVEVDNAVELRWMQIGEVDEFTVLRAEGETEVRSHFSAQGMYPASKVHLADTLIGAAIYKARVLKAGVGAWSYAIIAHKGAQESAPGNIRFLTILDAEVSILFHSEPETTVEAGTEFRYEVHAEASNGAQIAFRLLEGPAGMSIDAETGLLVWAAVQGSHTVRIEAATADGKTTEVQSFTLLAIDIAFTSTPIVSAEAGSEYRYQAAVELSSQQSLRFELLKAPVGMTVDSKTGLVVWTPQREMTANVMLAARVEASAVVKIQSWLITVGGCETPPLIMGEVRDEAGKPVSEGVIYIYKKGSLFLDSYTRVENGMYETEIAGEGEYQLLFSARNYTDIWFEHAERRRDALALTLECGNTVIADFTVKARESHGPRFEVSGMVEASGLLHLDACVVEFLQYDSTARNREPRNIIRTFVHLDGSYRAELEGGFAYIARLRPVLNLGIDLKNQYFGTVYYNGESSINAATRFVLNADMRNLNFRIAEESEGEELWIKGRISGSAGAALGAFITAFCIDDNDREQKERTITVETDAEGAFALRLLAEGEYLLHVTPFNSDYVAGYLSADGRTTLQWQSAARIRLSSAQPEAERDVKLSPYTSAEGNARLQGVVSARDNTIRKDGSRGNMLNADILKGVGVYLLNMEGRVVAWTYSDHEGNYRFDNLAESEYTLVADRVGYSSYEQELAVQEGPAQNTHNPVLQSNTTTDVEPVVGTGLHTAPQLYPNPAYDNTTLFYTAAAPGSVQIQISDARGQLLFDRRVHSAAGPMRYTLDTSTLAAGVYLVRILQQGQGSVAMLNVLR